MYYRLTNSVALRRWKYVDRAIYYKGTDLAQSISKEEFDLALLCDGEHDLAPDPYLATLLKKSIIEECKKGDKPSEWSLLKEYDNYYFPRMNLQPFLIISVG